MPSNIEIKARIRDWDHLQRVAQELCDQPMQVIDQEDVFFNVRTGRLKLRIFSTTAGEVIYYQRPDQAGPKQSRYQIASVPDPAAMRETLAAALGIRQVVRKRRHLYIVGQTRMHLDEVEGLGQFIELEVVLRPGQTAEEGQRVAEDLMVRLDIRSEDLVQGAYVDLLER